MADIHVDLVYAHTSTDLFYATYTVAQGTTIAQLITWSLIEQYYPQLAANTLPCGVFNVVVTPQYILQHNDRVELYRPLTITPIEARRIRAEKKRR